MTLGAALKPLVCEIPDCAFPEGGRCARAAEFDDPLAKCLSLERTTTSQVVESSPAPAKPVVESASVNPDEVAPWRGRHLNLVEAEDILRRAPARVISVLGPYDAGKTSLLASFFLQLANGQHGVFPYRFASSRTLYGFQDLVDRANAWSGQTHEQIVDHTPKDDGTHGGRFLHLGVRPADNDDDRHIDLLLSDVTGEWIDKWTARADAEGKRRLAFVPRSNGFIVVADAAKLISEDGMDADDAIGRLIRRTIAAAGPGNGRGFALVFSKFDKIIDEAGIEVPNEEQAQTPEAWGELGELTGAIWGALHEAKTAGFVVRVFPVSAFPRPLKEGQPAGVMAPFAHVMIHADRRERWSRIERPVPENADTFQAMRRWRADS
ncbi:MAG TPA: hypothetical protein PKA58_34850 [Polyangium sp.]|nr:hypothetical protein [Polyangium sp.]